MAKAIWEGTIIAESDSYEKVEGNVYFPPDSLKREHFREAARTTVCGWKGTANYFDIVVGDKVNEGAAWTYADPKPEAAAIKDHVAFWGGVSVTE